MPPVTEIAFVVGPMLPATKRGRRGVLYFSRDLRESRAAAALISCTRSARPYSASTIEPAAEGVRLDDVRAGVEVAVDGRRR